MILKTFIEPPIGNNNYLIIDESTKIAALVDCSYSDSNIVNTIKEYKAKLKYILLTHGHFDHITGINSLQLTPHPDITADGGVKVLMHKDDSDILKKVNMYLPAFGMPDITIPRIDRFVSDGDTVNVGTISLKVIHTPGHTQGGVCYLTENALFSGDTIFKESVGRCDLEGGDFSQLVDSIESKIFTLNDETKIYPGHGKPTTVGWEKIHNNFL